MHLERLALLSAIAVTATSPFASACEENSYASDIVSKADYVAVGHVTSRHDLSVENELLSGRGTHVLWPHVIARVVVTRALSGAPNRVVTARVPCGAPRPAIRDVTVVYAIDGQVFTSRIDPAEFDAAISRPSR